MSKKNGKNGTGLADPSRLNPLDSDDKQILRVVVETPKGSRNKFAFDPDQHLFQLKKVLPTGMAFPYDFGFVPSTEAEDGDPIDVLILMDEPGEQSDKKKKTIRNDRILDSITPMGRHLSTHPGKADSPSWW